MDGPASSARAKSLQLDGEDQSFLFKAILDSFGVDVGPEVSWDTLGDIHEALMAGLPAAARPGACATSMAFWRLRRVVAGAAPQGLRLTPSTPLKSVTRETPRRFFARLQRETGLEPAGLTLGWSGCLGVLVALLGFVAGMILHSVWAAVAMMAAGMVMMLLDQGGYGAKTMGELARNLARRNAGRLISEGADARPQAVWRTLCEIVADEAEVESLAGLTPQTRLG